MLEAHRVHRSRIRQFTIVTMVCSAALCTKALLLLFEILWEAMRDEPILTPWIPFCYYFFCELIPCCVLVFIFRAPNSIYTNAIDRRAFGSGSIGTSPQTSRKNPPPDGTRSSRLDLPSSPFAFDKKNPRGSPVLYPKSSFPTLDSGSSEYASARDAESFDSTLVPTQPSDAPITRSTARTSVSTSQPRLVSGSPYRSVVHIGAGASVGYQRKVVSENKRVSSLSRSLSHAPSEDGSFYAEENLLPQSAVGIPPRWSNRSIVSLAAPRGLQQRISSVEDTKHHPELSIPDRHFESVDHSRHEIPISVHSNLVFLGTDENLDLLPRRVGTDACDGGSPLSPEIVSMGQMSSLVLDYGTSLQRDDHFIVADDDSTCSTPEAVRVSRDSTLGINSGDEDPR